MAGRKKREPLRIRLTKTHSIQEIEEMIKKIKADPDSKKGATGVDLYNKAANKKLDEMSWAIYTLSKEDKYEQRQAGILS